MPDSCDVAGVLALRFECFIGSYYEEHGIGCLSWPVNGVCPGW
jgi:hypothetical protein